MGNYTIFETFENPRRGRQTRNFTTNVLKILDLKSPFEQIIFRKLTLGIPEFSRNVLTFTLHAFVLTQMCPTSSPVLSHAYFGALRRL